MCAKGRGLKKRTTGREKGFNTLIIKKAEGKTYADTVKSIRGVLKPEEKGIIVRKISETKDRNVVLRVREQIPGASSEVQRIITNETGNKTEKKKEAKILIMIHDLDGATNDDEIEQAIRDDSGEKGDIKIHAQNQSKNGGWTVKILLPKTSGESLLRNRTIKIGWIACRITGKISLPICLKL